MCEVVWHIAGLNIAIAWSGVFKAILSCGDRSGEKRYSYDWHIGQRKRGVYNYVSALYVTRT